MTEILAQWVKGMAFAALIGSVAMIITPRGKVKSVLRIVCGLALLTAMISPFLGLTAGDVGLDVSRYRANADRIAGEASQKAGELNRTIIEDRCGAYIMDKAATLGIEDFSVSVLCRWSEEQYWYPYEAELGGRPTVQQKNLMSAYLESELGITAQGQHWTGDETD